MIFCISAVVLIRVQCIPTSFSCRKSKLQISRKLTVLLGTCHVANPNLLLVFCFEYQVEFFLAVLVFSKLNWKSQTSFALLFSKTITRSHRSFYHTMSTPISSCYFVTAGIISGLVCLAKYLLLDKALLPATRCCTVSSCL